MNAEIAPAETIAPTPTPEHAQVKAAPTKAEARDAMLAEKYGKPRASAKAASPATAPTQQEAAVATEAHNPGPDGSTPSPATKAPSAPAAETFSFDDPAAESKPDGEVTTEEVPADELSALPDEVKKKIVDAQKESAKLRKQKKEAEAKLTEHESKLSEKDKTIEDLTTKLHEAQSRGGLAGNAFDGWHNAQAVSQWAGVGKEIVARANRIALAKATDAEISEDLLKIKLPNGNTVDLTPELYDTAEGWIADATQWFKHDEAVMKAESAAKPIVQKLSKMEGYQEAYDAYLADPHLAANIKVLAAKAAMFDVFEFRKGTVTFPGKAGAAKSASVSGAETQPRSVPQPTPPRELAAAQPRVAAPGHGDAARVAELTETAMKTGSRDALVQLMVARREAAKR